MPRQTVASRPWTLLRRLPCQDLGLHASIVRQALGKKMFSGGTGPGEGTSDREADPDRVPAVHHPRD
jgi:hypothetical protein